MAINISEFIRNNILQAGQSKEAAQILKEFAANSGVGQGLSGNALLQDMLAGDTFTGYVKEIKDMSVLLQLSDGSMVTARLNEGADIHAGQNATFMVEQNMNHQISLRVLQALDQQGLLIDKALDASGFPATENNINLVKELLSLNMPVNIDTIGDMARYSAKFPDADLNTIANLLRLEIPVTESNIMEFDAYRQFNGQLENNLSRLENQMFRDIHDILEGLTSGNGDADVKKVIQIHDDSLHEMDLNRNNLHQEGIVQGEKIYKNSQITVDKTVNMINNIVNAMYDGLESKESTASAKVQDVLTEKQIEKLTDNLNQLGEDGKALVKKIGEGLSVKELVNTVLSEKSNMDNESLFLRSDSFKDILHQVINETMKLTPRDVMESESAINNYYKRIKKNIDAVEEIAKNSGIETNFSKNVTDIKSNIDFMNDLNKNMTFFQMPIKFSESEGNGELYVFTNKRALASGTDNISAMLHLDMENLGPVDIYVKLNNKNVSTNFILESEELLDFVYQHIDKLNARLEKLGYSTHFEMKVSEPEDKLDFVQDFIEGDVAEGTKGQYIFDIKA